MATPADSSTTRATSRVDGWTIAALALFLARFFLPAEGVIEGQTLWIVCGWLGLAALRFFFHWRDGNAARTPWTLMDAAVALLVAGHLVSGGIAFATGGNLRSTLNSFWEWGGIAVAWLVLRELFPRSAHRALLLRCILLAAVSLSSLGIWQHFVWFPQLTREFREMVALREKSQTPTGLSLAERERMNQLSATLGDEFLKVDAQGRSLLTDRATASTEPIGLFALANTLAAVTLAGWLMTLHASSHVWLHERQLRAWLPWLACLAILSLCLLLSKSRGAWLAACCTLVVWAVAALLRKSLTGRKALRLALTGIVLAGVAVLVVWQIGGLDREVFSEAPKSLGYRIQYWQSTWALIQDHPVFGVGPGNFRQHYVLYKLPGASEEVRDPHNLILDVWANGGLLALIGLAGVIFAGASAGRRIWKSGLEAPAPSPPLRSVLTCGVWAIGSVGLQQGIFDAQWDPRLLAVLTVWCVLAGWLHFASIRNPLCVWAGWLASIGILVHLLASGGIAMPVILLLVLTLIGCCHAEANSEKDSVAFSPRLSIVAAIGFSLALWLCLWSSVIPGITVAAEIANGKAVWLRQRDLRSAERAFRSAAKSDSMAAEACSLLAQACHAQWVSDPGDSTQFDEAIAALDEARKRDPRDVNSSILESQWWLERFQREKKPEQAEAAVVASGRAATLSPQSTLAQATRALALAAANRADPELLAHVLEMDNENHRRAHLEVLLSSAVRLQLTRALDFSNLRQDIRRSLRQGREPEVPAESLEIFSMESLMDGIDPANP